MRHHSAKKYVIWFIALFFIYGCAEQSSEENSSKTSSANLTAKSVSHFFLAAAASNSYIPLSTGKLGMTQLNLNDQNCNEQTICEFQKEGLLADVKSIYHFHYVIEESLLQHKSINKTFRSLITNIKGLVINTRAGETIIAFRGTDSSNFQNMVANLMGLHLSHFQGFEGKLRIDPKQRPPVDNKFDNFVTRHLNQGRVKAHTGFYLSFEIFWKEFLMAQLQNPQIFPPGNKLLLTGHSLGGAYATLCASFLAAFQNASPTIKKHFQNIKEVVTFGAPRVGDRNMHFWYTSVVGLFDKTTLYINRLDLIPKLGPYETGYRHFGKIAKYKVPVDGKSHYEVVRATEKRDMERQKEAFKSLRKISSMHAQGWFKEKREWLGQKFGNQVSKVTSIFKTQDFQDTTNSDNTQSQKPDVLKEFYAKFDLKSDVMGLIICAHSMGYVPDDSPCGFFEGTEAVPNQGDEFVSYLERLSKIR